MYPLDRGMWGPTVRITHLRDELARSVELDMVEGYRAVRSGRLAGYAFAGRLRGLDAIYVESSTFLPSPVDLAFLGLARTLGIPVLTYIRDAYQLFEEYYPIGSTRRWLGAKAFLPAIRALAAVSSRVAVPSEGLARAVFGDDHRAVVIPPGSRPPLDVPRAADADALLFVGNGRVLAQGGPRLIEAVGRARDRGAGLRLVIVSRPGEEPIGPRPEWLTVHHGEQAEIARLLPQVVATVIPRPRGPYNDLAVPVKLFDYLAYGRPLLVTDCAEQAAIVRRADAGIVTAGDADAMADAIVRLAGAESAELASWSSNARRAAVANAWERRAHQILGVLGLES
jgi:glycosyltransferase involved in cell wall biosynthesis